MRRQTASCALEALIDALKHLYLLVSSALVRMRMDGAKPRGRHASDLGVASALYSLIRGAGRERSGNSAKTSDETGAPRTGEPDAASGDSAVSKGRAASVRRSPNALSDRLETLNVYSPARAQVGVKLGVSAEEHINRSLWLVRHGKAEAAKLHADLAESAARIAADYMPDEDYRVFRARLREKLESTNQRLAS